jgi:hypothetical protein
MKSIVDAIAKVCGNIGREGIDGRHEGLRTTG